MIDNQDIESPCNGRCVIEEKSGYCEGCGRTMPEIVKWTEFSDQTRAYILRALAKRLEHMND